MLPAKLITMINKYVLYNLYTLHNTAFSIK